MSLSQSSHSSQPPTKRQKVDHPARPNQDTEYRSISEHTDVHRSSDKKLDAQQEDLDVDNNERNSKVCSGLWHHFSAYISSHLESHQVLSDLSVNDLRIRASFTRNPFNLNAKLRLGIFPVPAVCQIPFPRAEYHIQTTRQRQAPVIQIGTFHQSFGTVSHQFSSPNLRSGRTSAEFVQTPLQP